MLRALLHRHVCHNSQTAIYFRNLSVLRDTKVIINFRYPKIFKFKGRLPATSQMDAPLPLFNRAIPTISWNPIKVLLPHQNLSARSPARLPITAANVESLMSGVGPADHSQCHWRIKNSHLIRHLRDMSTSRMTARSSSPESSLNFPTTFQNGPGSPKS